MQFIPDANPKEAVTLKTEYLLEFYPNRNVYLGPLHCQLGTVIPLFAIDAALAKVSRSGLRISPATSK